MSKQNQEVVSKLIKITILSFLFMTVQFVGGYLAHSVAIWSDAFHLLSDVLAYAISLIAVILSEKKSPSNLTFGWLKAQTLGALLNVIFIYLVTIQLFIEATHRMIKKDKVEEPKYMLITSIFGLICNFIVLSILHNDPNGGHHGCSHNHGSHQHHEHNHSHDSHQHSHDGKPCKGHHASLNELQSVHTQHDHSHNQQSCNRHHHNHNEDLNQHIEHKHDEHHHGHHHEHHENLHQHQHENEHGHNEKGCCKHQKTNKSKNETEKDSSDQVIQDTGRSINKNLPQIEHDQLRSVGSDEQIKKDPHHNHTSKFTNINLEAAHIHIITDIILSIGVIIAAFIIYFFAPQNAEWSPWHLADPMCTYLFSVLAIYSTWPILKESLLILLDGCDNPQLLSEIEFELKRTEGVRQIKDLKIWSVNRGKYYAGVKVKLKKGQDSCRVKKVFTLRGIDCFVDVEVQQLQLSQ